MERVLLMVPVAFLMGCFCGDGVGGGFLMRCLCGDGKFLMGCLCGDGGGGGFFFACEDFGKMIDFSFLACFFFFFLKWRLTCAR